MRCIVRWRSTDYEKRNDTAGHRAADGIDAAGRMGLGQGTVRDDGLRRTGRDGCREHTMG
ncbi:MAG: hypothetical protein J6Q95_03255 [Alistipes sp.]|nr:hypothetical protein [Alistipes sp.]